MTAQIPDRLRYAGREYLVLGARGVGLFDPSRFGLTVRMISTACYRGFHCSYVLDGHGSLLLQDVYLGLDEESPSGDRSTLFGRTPERYMREGRKLVAGALIDHAWLSHDRRLTGLSEPMAFDGQMLIGTGYLEAVRELAFEGGRLVSELDGEAVVDRILHRARDSVSSAIPASDIELWTAKLKAFGYRTLATANMRNALRAEETCAIEVSVGAGLEGRLTAFKIYVNGNIRGPRPGIQDKSWDQLQLLPFKPGAYRIVLRGKDVADPQRLESNTLHFNIKDGERLRIVARMIENALTIQFADNEASGDEASKN